jgi:hypothetical protein
MNSALAAEGTADLQRGLVQSLPRHELVDENPAVQDSAYPLGFPAPDGEAADGRHASDHARSPIYRAAAPRCLSKKALISPKASFVSGA